MPRQKSDATDGSAVTPETDVTPAATQPESVRADDPVSPAEATTPEEAPVVETPEGEPVVETPEEAPAAAMPEEAPVGETPEETPVAEAEAPLPPGEPAQPEGRFDPPAPVEEPPAERESPRWSSAEPVSPVAPPEPQDPPAEPQEEHHEEESGPSFAARALTFLLVLIAGAALGIWGAPKLAPLLPSGLGPVAAWLAPGQKEAEARIAELGSQLDAAIRELEPRLTGLATSGDVDARITAAVQGAESRVAGELDTLRESIGQVDGADTRQRLARLESAIDGQAAELETLKQQISAAPPAEDGAGTAQIDVYRAELDGLRAEMATLSDEVQALAARVDDVDAKAERQIETAQSRVAEIQAQSDTALGAATIEADLALIRAAITGGLPFAGPLDRIAAQPGVTVPEGLTAAAPTGVPTLAMLRESFADAAHSTIRASIMASAGDGLVARSRAFLEAQVASRSLTPQPGTAPDAVLSRMEDRLRQDDLDGAIAGAGELPSEAAAAMEPWLAAARLRAGAIAGLATLEGALKAMN